MIIPITLSSFSSSPSTSLSSSANTKLPPGLVKISNDEILLIELQGSLEVEPSDPSERNGKLVGTLKIDEATSKPTLLIGHHLLEGKVGALPKPYAILVRRTRGEGTIRRRTSKNGGTDTTTSTSALKNANANAALRSSRTSDSQRSKNADQTHAVASDPDDVELMDVDVDFNSRHPQGPDFSGEGEEEEEGVDEGENGGPGSESESGAGAGWAIAGIVKKKIIFSKRPMPVTVRK